MEDLKSYIRNIKDFPKKGIIFRDITTLLKNPIALKSAADMLIDLYKNKKIDKVVGIESRGFILGSVIAYELKAGFVPARKPNKLPSDIIRQEYQLEYGKDSIEIHKDSILPGENILLHDDLLATGGTAAATCKLIEKLGGKIIGISFIIELSFLNGRAKLNDYDVQSLIQYNYETE